MSSLFHLLFNLDSIGLIIFLIDWFELIAVLWLYLIDSCIYLSLIAFSILCVVDSLCGCLNDCVVGWFISTGRFYLFHSFVDLMDWFDLFSCVVDRLVRCVALISLGVAWIVWFDWLTGLISFSYLIDRPMYLLIYLSICLSMIYLYRSCLCDLQTVFATVGSYDLVIGFQMYNLHLTCIAISVPKSSLQWVHCITSQRLLFKMMSLLELATACACLTALQGT